MPARTERDFKKRKTTAGAVAALAVLAAVGVVVFRHFDDRKPSVEFLGFTDVLDRRVARFAISNSTDRAFLVTTLPTNGYIPTPVEPSETDYVDIPNPLTNRFWPAELRFQVETHSWRMIWEAARHGRFQQVGTIARETWSTNRHRYFIAHHRYDVSFNLDD